MSRKCLITGRGPLSGNNRSHALNATRRKWNVNLQTKVVNIDGQKVKVRASVRGLRTLKKLLG
jgi:large subunit ribosomal protein L28